MGAIKSLIRRSLRAAGYEIDDAREIDTLRRWQCPFVPPGHYYSPYPDLEAIRAREASIFDGAREVRDIDLREDEQLKWLQRMADLYPSIDLPETKTDGFRYYLQNGAYSYSDGIVLHCMLRLIRPKRLVEVGCGYSSAATLDTNERHLGNAVQITFVEPYPELLYTLMNDEDRQRHTIVPSKLQDVELSLFETLESGDVLFIDSTHVAKVDSDVNLILFEILPRLKNGVYIHFHDVFFPFEYPKEWVYEGRAWQELYLLRALLQNNPRYSIEYFQHFMVLKHRGFFSARLPLCLKNPGGNLWLRKSPD